MVLCRLFRQQNLFFLQRGPEGVGYLVGGAHGGVEIYVGNIEVHRPRHYRVVKAGGHAKGLCDCGQQRAPIPTVVEIGSYRVRRHPQLPGSFEQARLCRRLGKGIANRIPLSLPCEFIGRIKLLRAPEIRQRLHLSPAQQ